MLAQVLLLLASVEYNANKLGQGALVGALLVYAHAILGYAFFRYAAGRPLCTCAGGPAVVDESASAWDALVAMPVCGRVCVCVCVHVSGHAVYVRVLTCVHMYFANAYAFLLK